MSLCYALEREKDRQTASAKRQGGRGKRTKAVKLNERNNICRNRDKGRSDCTVHIFFCKEKIKYNPTVLVFIIILVYKFTSLNCSVLRCFESCLTRKSSSHI